MYKFQLYVSASAKRGYKNEKTSAIVYGSTCCSTSATRSTALATIHASYAAAFVRSTVVPLLVHVTGTVSVIDVTVAVVLVTDVVEDDMMMFTEAYVPLKTRPCTVLTTMGFSDVIEPVTVVAVAAFTAYGKKTAEKTIDPACNVV